jgi:hypothetical protein
MLDLAIVLALIVLNAFAHSAYVRWRRAPKSRRAKQPAARRGLAYPTHPSPGLIATPEHAAIRPVGIDW